MPISHHAAARAARRPATTALLLAAVSAGPMPAPATPDERTPAMPPGQLTEHAHTNRLADETSPYLLQHAHNPVDWYPWGPEAFEAAREQDKPIFLSVGYSTCYWCHVMERECFEDPQIAAVMNEHCICVKVDREERPDVDDVYMTAVQLLTRQGGWPMSVFLEPGSLRPFFGGTYFPPEPRSGLIAFPDLVRQVGRAWHEQRDGVLQRAEEVARAVREQLAEQRRPSTLNEATVETAVAQVMGGFDPVHGGFGGGRGHAPKFPTPVNLELLASVAWSRDDVRAAVGLTLDRMATGGLFDQVGGGFHRYSVDAEWLVPHFEKMLYDQGQLAGAYADSFDRTGDAFHGRIAEETCRFVLREMTHERGGFLSAIDAEVNAREGLNYLWTPDEVRSVLAAAGLDGDVDLALRAYGLDGPANFQDPHHPEEPRRWVLRLADRPDRLAATMGIDAAALLDRLDRVDAALLAHRDTRQQPSIDDKVIASWNGLMIAGMARAGAVLDRPELVEAAGRAATFVLEEMRDADGGLLRTWRAGEARIPGFLEDHAAMIRGLLALREATGDERWLRAAEDLAARARARFRNEVGGGWFDTLADQDDLFVRARSVHDGATPCGMSIMVGNLLALAERSGEQRHVDDAGDTLRAMSHVLATYPAGACLAAAGLHRFLERHGDAALAVDAGAAARHGVLDVGLRPMAPGPGQADDVRRGMLMLRIDAGWHLTAHDPGHPEMKGLEVVLTGAPGLELDVEHPAGTLFDGPLGTIRVLEGLVEIPLLFRGTIGEGDRPMLLIRSQACNDEVCLEPREDVVPVPVGR